MSEDRFMFGKMYELTNIGISIFQEDQMIHPPVAEEFFTVKDNENLRHRLMRLADETDAPAVYLDAHKVAYGVYHYENQYYIFGPAATEHMTRVELHRYYFDYGMKKGEEKPLPVITYHRFLSYVSLGVLGISGIAYSSEKLLQQNDGTAENADKDTPEEFQYLTEENEFHHTYLEEQSLLDCVREGRPEDAIRYCTRMDSEQGIMSKNEIRHWQKNVTVAIALNTRAAIEGGIPPSEAYALSDYFLQKSDECKDVPALINCRNQAVREFAFRVQERKKKRETSSYIARCCDYVGKHYREKIYLEDLAKKLGISPSYLSRMFAKEMGKTLQEYITETRVERAANLLMYSDESLARIGDYVNFPSQSYFGRVFRKYKHMTPGEFRERWKPKEF